MEVNLAQRILPFSILARQEEEKCTISTALTAIGAVGGLAALTMIGCFRINEKNEMVMRDTGDAFSFITHLTEFLRAIGE